MLELQVAGKSSALTSKPTKGLKQQLMTVEHELIMVHFAVCWRLSSYRALLNTFSLGKGSNFTAQWTLE